jgi:hypothetical protein
VEGEGPPTGGMRQVLDEQEKELADYERQTQAFFDTEVAALNAAAAKLNLPFVVR